MTFRDLPELDLSAEEAERRWALEDIAATVDRLREAGFVEEARRFEVVATLYMELHDGVLAMRDQNADLILRHNRAVVVLNDGMPSSWHAARDRLDDVRVILETPSTAAEISAHHVQVRSTI